MQAHAAHDTMAPEVARRRPNALQTAAPVATEWSAAAILLAQQTAGNRAVSRVMAVQRQGDPGAPPPPPPEVSPADRQKQLYAAAVVHDVPPIDAATKANVEKAVSFAPIYADIQDKAKLQKDVTDTNDALAKANNELTIKQNNVHDYSGAPGGSGPGSGIPEQSQRELDQAKADVARLSEKAQTLADQFKAKSDMVTKELAAVGVKSEDELTTFVEQTFPNSFVDRGAQIAITALEANRKAAQKEQERYKADHAGTGDRKGLQDACRDLDARVKEIVSISQSRTSELPEGGADPNDPAVQEYAAIQAKIAPKQEELDKKKAEYQLKYPILFKADPQQIAEASDSQLDAVVEGPIKVILDNIDTTEQNINDRSLKVWKLKGSGVDIPTLTKDELGIKPGSTLDGVVEKFAAEDKTTGEKVTDALNALSMVADTIGLVTGPLGAAIAVGVTAVAAVANVVVDYQTFTANQAAGNVAVDPQFQSMMNEEPGLTGMLLDLVNLGLSVIGVRAALNAFKAAKVAAAASEAAAAAEQGIADLEKFKKSINGANIEEKAKQRLIDEAERQFAAQPKLALKSAKEVGQELIAIQTSASDAAKVRIGRIVDKYENEAFTKTFLELTENGRIRTLNAEGLGSAGMSQDKLAEFTKKYLTGPNADKYPAFVYPGPPRMIFLKPASEERLAEAVVHELVHDLQKSTGSAAKYVGEPAFFYYQEHQAYLEQQSFMKKIVADQGIEVVPEDSRWLVDATREEITAHIAKYPGAPAPVDRIPVSEDELGQLLNDMLARNEATRQKLILKKAEQMAR